MRFGVQGLSFRREASGFGLRMQGIEMKSSGPAAFGSRLGIDVGVSLGFWILGECCRGVLDRYRLYIYIHIYIDEYIYCMYVQISTSTCCRPWDLFGFLGYVFVLTAYLSKPRCSQEFPESVLG